METFKALVRPLVTFAVVGAFIWGFVTGQIEAQIFVPIVTLIIGFYFEERAVNKKIGG